MSSVVHAQGLGKKHTRNLRLGARYAVADIAGELVPFYRDGSRLRRGEFWALHEVDLRIEAGDAVALLGPNGAGKSTLLMLIAGILKPDQGRVRTSGRVHAVLELGAGFDEALTGRENAQLGAAIHGLRGPAARTAVDEALAFAELGAVVGAPLRSYSSGMRARLAYAVAVSVRPDVLLVDEVLSVGDLNFQRKCLEHMGRFLADGGTLLFVSHSFFLAQSTCRRAVVLDRGRVAFDGAVVDAVAELLQPDAGASWQPSRHAGPLQVDAVRTSGPVSTGEPLEIELAVSVAHDLDIRWTFSIWTAHESVCVTGGWAPASRRLRTGTGTLRCTVPRVPLLAGQYVIRLGVVDARTNVPLVAIGYDDPGVPLHVTWSPDLFANQQLESGQLTSVDVDWN